MHRTFQKVGIGEKLAAGARNGMHLLGIVNYLTQGRDQAPNDKHN
jgi:hypothetical protein